MPLVMVRLARRSVRFARGHVRWLVPVILLAALVVLLLPSHKPATAAYYADPFWEYSSSSANVECACGCGCPGPSVWSPEGVSYLDGSLRYDHYLFSGHDRSGD